MSTARPLSASDLEFLQHQRPGNGIQVVDGLVEQQDGRILRQQTGEGERGGVRHRTSVDTVRSAVVVEAHGSHGSPGPTDDRSGDSDAMGGDMRVTAHQGCDSSDGGGKGLRRRPAAAAPAVGRSVGAQLGKSRRRPG